MEPTAGGRATLYRIEFNEHVEAHQGELLEFTDPSPCKAASTSTVVEPVPDTAAAAEFDSLEVLAVPRDVKDEPRWRKELRAWVERSGSAEAVAVISVKVEDAIVLWRPGRATIQASPERIGPALLALAEFAFFEAQLRRLEAETAQAWPEAQGDVPLTFHVGQAELDRQAPVGQRAGHVFDRRIRYVRIEPHLYSPAATLPALAQQLGEELREKARVEDRLESLDGKTEVFEYIYELAGQRISDYSHFRRGIFLELLIVVFLAFEVGLMAVECFLTWWEA